MRVAAMCLVVAGCNSLFAIAPTELEPDAAPPPDTDGDGTIDADDNCPAIANDQRDGDEDAVGDVCDNCPLISNVDQRDADADSAGDACDARPLTVGDCLVLFDRFDDPARFWDHWEMISATPSAPPAVDAQRNAVTITPQNLSSISFVARDASGARYAGLFDTEVRARATLTGGELCATTNTSTNRSGYKCGITDNNVDRHLRVQAESVGPLGYGGGSPTRLSAEPIHPRTILRLTAPTAADPVVSCRVEHGFAAGASRFRPSIENTFPGDGAPGVSLSHAAVTLEAVALYRTQAGPCTTIYR